MNPALIPLAVEALVQVYQKVRELSQKKKDGTITPQDIDELFALYASKSYDQYIEEARQRAG